MAKPVIILGAFDNLRSREVRFIEEASKLGEVNALVYPDHALALEMGSAPKFPLTERLYMLRALRFVCAAIPLESAVSPAALANFEQWQGSVWADQTGPFNETRRKFCVEHGIEYHLIAEPALEGFPQLPPAPEEAARKKVVVTGSFDWLHSGHVRFFEEVSGYGELHVIVGHDANIRLLKGQGHPLLPQDERRYMVSSIRYVTQAVISSGEGWLDADPEIQKIKPDFYAVNKDGDRGGKRQYCDQRGIEYLVLERTPAAGLPPRSSTDLRGF
jgi:cytidyltransferase-like protein